MYINRSAGLISLSVCLLASQQALAAKPVKKHVPATTNYSKGQTQLAGGNGEFGVVWTTKDLWNIELLSARYSVDPFLSNDSNTPQSTEKMLVINFAIKNADKGPSYWYGYNEFYAIDQYGKQYPMTSAMIASDPHAGIGMKLQPGQGAGQPGLHNPCSMVFEIAAKSNIQKIMVHDTRLGSSDQIFRYYMSTATAAEDGANGDPKNIIAPLPKGEADPSDKSGFTPLAVCYGGKPGDGTKIPANTFYLTVNSFGDSPDGTTIGGTKPQAGKKFVQAILTVTNPDVVEQNTYYMENWDNTTSPVVIDTDGDPYGLADGSKEIKASSDDSVDIGKIAGGVTRKFRFIFEVPQNAKLATLQLAGDNGRPFGVDISGN